MQPQDNPAERLCEGKTTRGGMCRNPARDVDWTAARIRVRQNYVLGEFGTPKSRRSTRTEAGESPARRGSRSAGAS